MTFCPGCPHRSSYVALRRAIVSLGHDPDEVLVTEEIAPDRIGLALSSDDVREIAASGRKVAMIGVENAYSLGTDLSRIQDFHDRGARYMSLSHNGHSQFSDSNTGERDGVWLHGGLSDLGREAVAELNRVGIMIDLSHPSKASNLEVMSLSQAPVIASHSSARALNDVSRNMDDEQLMALRDNGGVIQTVALASYVDAEKNAAHNDASAAILATVADRLASAQIRNLATIGGNLCLDTRCTYYDQNEEWRKAIGYCMKKEGETCWVAPSSKRCLAVSSTDTSWTQLKVSPTGSPSRISPTRSRIRGSRRFRFLGDATGCTVLRCASCRGPSIVMKPAVSGKSGSGSGITIVGSDEKISGCFSTWTMSSNFVTDQ